MMFRTIKTFLMVSFVIVSLTCFCESTPSMIRCKRGKGDLVHTWRKDIVLPGFRSERQMFLKGGEFTSKKVSNVQISKRI